MSRYVEGARELRAFYVTANRTVDLPVIDEAAGVPVLPPILGCIHQPPAELALICEVPLAPQIGSVTLRVSRFREGDCVPARAGRFAAMDWPAADGPAWVYLEVPTVLTEQRLPARQEEGEE